MGCATSASPGNRSGAQSTNGSVDAPLPEPVDPRLPLTARQRFSIQKSWKAIARNMETTGVTMFVKLFLQHEELLAVFKKKFKDVPVDQLAKSPELENHASQVMSTLDEAIHSLNNLNFFFELLYTIGVTHRDIAGFRPEYFWRIEQPFLDAVKETLGERYTHNMEQIYQVTIKFIIDTLYKGYTKGAVK